MSTEVTSPNCALRVRMHKPLTESQNRTFESFELEEITDEPLSLTHSVTSAVENRAYPLTIRLPSGLNMTEDIESEWPGTIHS